MGRAQQNNEKKKIEKITSFIVGVWIKVEYNITGFEYYKILLSHNNIVTFHNIVTDGVWQNLRIPIYL